jgi:hypothetical protein
VLGEGMQPDGCIPLHSMMGTNGPCETWGWAAGAGVAGLQRGRMKRERGGAVVPSCDSG